MQQTKEIMDADKQADQKIEDKHEEEEKKRILQYVEDILGLTYLMQLHPHDMIVKVYGMAFGVGYEACREDEGSGEPLRNEGWG